MAKEIYIGDGTDKARKMTDIYIGGSDGTAKTVLKGYIGDENGKARQFFQRKDYYTRIYHAAGFMTRNETTIASSYETADYTYNGLTEANSGSWCEIVPVYGSYTTSTIYWRFSNSIPQTAKITAISARVKTASSTAGNGTGHSGWINQYDAQFMKADGTLMGSATQVAYFNDVNLTARIYNLDLGDPSEWNPSDLNRMFLRLTVRRTDYYSWSDFSVRFYGSDLAVTYRY